MNLSNKKWTIWDGLKLPFSVSPYCMLCRTLYHLICAALPALSLAATSAFLDTAMGIKENGAGIAGILLPLCGIVAVLIWTHLGEAISGFAQIRIGIRLQEVMQTEFFRKLAVTEYASMEDPHIQDLIERVGKNPEKQVQQMGSSIIALFTLLAQNFSVLLIVLAHSWWAGLIMVLAAIPLVMQSIKAGKQGYQAQVDVTRFTRKYQYYSRLLLDRSTAAERTLFSYSAPLNQRYKDEFNKSYQKEKHVMIKSAFRMNLSGLAAAVFAGFCVFALIIPVRSGTMSIGLYISLVGTIFTLVNSIMFSLSPQMESLAKSRVAARELTELCSLPETPGAADTPAISVPVLETIEFRNVYFGYPRAEEQVLQGLNMTLHAGNHYAIVGENGAGKTTIVKLLSGLYSNYQGEILLNGKELRSYSSAQRKAYFSEVYQDFARYSVTLKENICFDLQSTDEKSSLPEILEFVQMDDIVRGLPMGLETRIGKIWDDGVDFSNGQWQKIALARALANHGEMMILDEPTAAMDPILESKVFEQLHRLCKDRTALFISHRLGSIQPSDYVFVLKGGKVAEQGLHENLAKQAGLYAEMVDSQRGWYQ